MLANITNEKKNLRARLRAYRRNGAILDEAKCKEVRQSYFSVVAPLYKRVSSDFWRGFQTAARLATGLRIFEGGLFTHPCGDPETRWNIPIIATYFNYIGMKDEPGARLPKWPGPDAVRDFYWNLSNLPYSKYMGQEHIEEAKKGVQYAAEMLGFTL